MQNYIFAVLVPSPRGEDQDEVITKKSHPQ